MLNYTDLEYKILQLIEQASVKSTIGSLQGGRLVLGGVTGPSGGTGGPLQPFIGQLRQSDITFDETEDVTITIPASGTSLVTNLNRIRAGYTIVPTYSPLNFTVAAPSNLIEFLTGIDAEFGLLESELDVLETTVSGILESGTGGGGHVIQWDEEPVPQRENLNFVGMVGVEDDEESTTSINIGMRNVLYVDPNDSYCEYSTIQDAIDNVGIINVNKILEVAPGTYEEDLTVPSGVTLRGQCRERCTIEGTVTLQHAVLSSFTVTKNYASSSDVYGVYIPSGYTATIEDSDIVISNSLGSAYAVINSGVLNFQDTYFEASAPSGIVPTQTDLSAEADTGLASYYPTYNYGASTMLSLGRDPDYDYFRVLLDFDLSGIADEITSAELILYNEAGALDEACSVYRILAANDSWIEGTKNAAAADAGEPNWSYKASPATAWAGAAGLGTSDTDYAATALGSIASVGSVGQFTITLSAAEVEKLRDGTYTNAGFLIKTPESSGSNKLVIIATKEHATSAHRPILRVGTSGTTAEAKQVNNSGSLISNRHQVIISNTVPAIPQPYMLWVDTSG